MDKQKVIRDTVEHVKQLLSGEWSGHDWWHVSRVWKMSQHIASEEGNADLFVVELAALLHDIADWKFHDGDDTVGPKAAREWLEKNKVDKETVNHVCEIIQFSSFKGAEVENQIKTREGMIVQDADRLDALGATGISRTFAYGGSKGREIHNPEIKPEPHQSVESYKTNNSSSINHFYEKLLLLKDRMNTETGKKVAEGRHKFLEEFLDHFYKEWEGKE